MHKGKADYDDDDDVDDADRKWREMEIELQWKCVKCFVCIVYNIYWFYAKFSIFLLHVQVILFVFLYKRLFFDILHVFTRWKKNKTLNLLNVNFRKTWQLCWSWIVINEIWEFHRQIQKKICISDFKDVNLRWIKQIWVIPQRHWAVNL